MSGHFDGQQYLVVLAHDISAYVGSFWHSRHQPTPQGNCQPSMLARFSLARWHMADIYRVVLAPVGHQWWLSKMTANMTRHWRPTKHCPPSVSARVSRQETTHLLSECLPAAQPKCLAPSVCDTDRCYTSTIMGASLDLHVGIDMWAYCVG